MKTILLVLLCCSISSFLSAQTPIEDLEKETKLIKKKAGKKSLAYANALIILAEAYQKKQDWDKAEEHLEAALEITKLPSKGRADSLLNQVNNNYHLAKWKAAFSKGEEDVFYYLGAYWFADCAAYNQADHIRDVMKMVYADAIFQSEMAYKYWSTAKEGLSTKDFRHNEIINELYSLMALKAEEEFGKESKEQIGVLYSQMVYNERAENKTLAEELEKKIAIHWGTLGPITSLPVGIWKLADTTSSGESTITKKIDGMAEEMPRFPGCEDAIGTTRDKKKCADKKMLAYIYSQVEYSSMAREYGIEGMAVIEFVVSEQGYIYDTRIMRDPGGEIGKEALRAVQLINEIPYRWTPARRAGKAIPLRYAIPIRFKLR